MNNCDDLRDLECAMVGASSCTQDKVVQLQWPGTYRHEAKSLHHNTSSPTGQNMGLMDQCVEGEMVVKGARQVFGH
ncbi:unnamed protein product [Sphenostylis stenocarpa]|uniref:Uncharacterized protein n=1 Tax=Sphenostylis stenocarpa TaxID=92480 RepID=A0AA86S723_9FABA|nr:unnamed protein product [Sphenostylis stenocarpa]